MKKNITLILLCLLVVCVVAWWPSGNENQSSRPLQVPVSNGAKQAATDGNAGLERVPTGNQFIFIDSLTGESLPAVDIGWSFDLGGSVPLVSPEKAPKAIVEAGKGYWTISSAGVLLAFQVDETHVINSEYHLPVTGVVNIQVFESISGEKIKGAKCLVGKIDKTKFMDCVGIGDGGVEVAIAPIGTSAYTRKIYESKYGAIDLDPSTEVENTDGVFSHSFFGATFIGLQVFHEEYGHQFVVADVKGGEVSVVEVPLERRPKVVGVLQNAAGRPLPAKGISVLVELSEASNDLGDFDGRFATVAYGEPGNWHRVARISTVTDDLGGFEMIMPNGVRFAAEYSSKDAYGFAESKVFETPPINDIFLEVSASSFEEGYAVWVEREDGGPIAGIHIWPRIADDLPWFRQFPGVPVNEAGIAWLPMLEAGQEKVRLFAQTGWDWADSERLFKSKLMTLPPSPFHLVIPISE